jgi:hypothetical protein
VSSETFGARYLSLQSAQERLDFEREESRRAGFDAVDAQLDDIVLRALRGEQVIRVSRPENRREHDGVHLEVSGKMRPALDEHFAVERQQDRGAWYIPHASGLSVGVVHTVHWWQLNRRFVVGMALRDTAGTSFDTSDAVVIWSALEPLFEDLFLPLKLRSARLAPKTRDKQLPYWEKIIRPAYEALSHGADAVSQYGPGTGWAELDADGVMARRDALLSSWAQADIDTARRLRTYRISRLVEHYYSKAKNGRALRRRVTTNGLDRALTAYFAGDWLAFLAYLGEEPDPNDEVTTALPKPQLIVGSAQRAATVAAAHGLPAEEVERMLDAFWNGSGGTSPVEERTNALRRFWQELDAIHKRQQRGMKALWGLMDPSGLHVGGPVGDSSDGYNPGLEKELLSSELLADLKRLWRTKPFKSPERLVTEPAPTSAAAKALGPAFVFWQELGVSVWFICEGPTRSRTDLSGLEEYLRDRPGFTQLAAMGYPVDTELFVELRAAESKLGPPEQYWKEKRQIGPDATIRRGGERRDGFELLRDIVTRHRRDWTAEHFDAYLRSRWRDELLGVGEAYNRFAADKTKPPTITQFMKMATPAVGNWFAGDLSAVYSALGLKAPMTSPTYAPLLVEEPVTPLTRVFSELGGESHPRSGMLALLADKSLEWVELAEGLGRAPLLKEFGARTIESWGKVLDDDVDKAWEKYTAAIQRALLRPQAPVAENQPAAAVPARTERPAAESAELNRAAGSRSV